MVCQTRSGQIYALYVYVEDHRFNTDGTLSRTVFVKVSVADGSLAGWMFIVQGGWVAVFLFVERLGFSCKTLRCWYVFDRIPVGWSSDFVSDFQGW